jgi:hypothetical protein
MQNQPTLPPRATHLGKNAAPEKELSRHQTAQYIADMALELRNLAKGQSLLSLQGLLEVAYYEAFSAATEIQIPEGEQERLAEMTRASLKWTAPRQVAR